MATLSGMTTTGNLNTQERLVRDVSNELAILQPSATPWISFLMLAQNKNRPAKAAKVEWFESEVFDQWDVEAGGGLDNAANSTALVVGDITKYKIGDLILVPPAVGSALQPEMLRVTAVTTGTSTCTVVRGVGSTRYAITDGQALHILGSAHEEGSNRPVAKDVARTACYNYCQIFREAIAQSGTQLAIEAYAATPNDFSQSLALKGLEFKRRMNDQMYFGQKSEDLTGGPNSLPIRTVGGLNSFLSTNVVSGGGALTQKTFLGWLEQCATYGSSKKYGLFAPKLMTALAAWKLNMLQISSVESSIGLNVTRIVTPHGMELDVMVDRSLNNKSAALTTGFAGWGFIIDPANVRYVPLRDSRVIEVRNTSDQSFIYNGQDAAHAEFFAEASLEVRLEKTHGKLYNVTDYVA